MAEIPSNSNRPGDAAWRIVEPHWESVSIYDGPLVFLHGFERLTVVARHLLAVRWCDSEVCNGGFHQFFSNSTGVLAPEALEGYRAIGLHECAEITQAAIGLFEEPYPRDRDARCEALQAIQLPGESRKQWDPFYGFDDRYYAARKRERFYEKMDDFALRHNQ